MDLTLWLVYQAFDTKNYHLPSIPAKRPPKIIPAGQHLECSLESHKPNTYCLLQMGSDYPVSNQVYQQAVIMLYYQGP